MNTHWHTTIFEHMLKIPNPVLKDPGFQKEFREHNGVLLCYGLFQVRF